MSKDMINHPDHYKTKNGLETIDVIEAFTEDLTGIEAVCTGNAIKYICRWNKKNGVEDINKAIWYLKKLREDLHKKHRDEDGPIYKWIEAIKKHEENKEEKQNEDKDKNEDWWAEHMIEDLETVTWPPAGDDQECNDIKKVLRLDAELCVNRSSVVKEAYLKQFLCAGSAMRTNSREDFEDFLLHLEDYDRDVFTKGHCLNSTKIIVWSGTQKAPIDIPYDVREDIIINWDGAVVFTLVNGQLKAIRASQYDGSVSPMVWKK